MANRKQSRGNCEFCGKEMTRGGLSKHLNTCKARQAANDTAIGKPSEIFHLVVESTESPLFWLHLEMGNNIGLDELDMYLRSIWLDCCGHMSAFIDGDVWYKKTSPGGWNGEEPITTKLGDVLHVGKSIGYEYDFGSTSYLKITAKASRNGAKLSEHPIYLMGQNNLPEEPCRYCGKPSGYLCNECYYKDDVHGFLCADHAENHPHDDYGGVFTFVNSPRVGVCGDLDNIARPY